MLGKNRIAYIDIAKGIALLLVIFGHTFRESMREAYYWCDFSYLFVYKFHVSLFFFLSGVSYNIGKEKYLNGNKGKFVLRKMKTVLLPWFSYSVAVYAVFCAAWCVPQIRSMLDGTAYSIIGPTNYLIQMLKNENPYAFHLWFLNTLFFVSVLCFATDALFNEKKSFAVKVVLLILAPIIYNLWAADNIWLIKGFFQKLPFFLAGAMLNRKTVEDRPAMWSAAGAAAIALLAIYTVFGGRIQASTEIFWIVLMYAEQAVIVILSLGVMGICFLFQTKLKLLERLGQHSMKYYLYHQPFCCAFVGMLLFDRLGKPATLVVGLCMILSIVLPFIFVKIVKVLRLEKFFTKIGLPV